MKKSSQKGFLLVETLLVSVAVSGILIYLYFQFSNINNSYDMSYRYNTVEDIYAVNDIKTLLLSASSSEQQNELNKVVDRESIVELGCEQDTYWTPGSVCNALMTELEVKKIYITQSNLSGLRYNGELTDKLNDKSETLKTFIEMVDYTNSPAGYRIIVEFNNDRAATITL